jgi:hypothetical protein
MRNITLLDIYYRAKRASFSFDFKQNFADTLIYFYYSFFNYFKTPNVINFFINLLCRFSSYNYDDLIKIQNQRLNLKKNEHLIFQIKQNLKITQDLEIPEVKDIIDKGYADVSNIINVDYRGFNNEIDKLKAYNSQVPIQSTLKLCAVNEKFNYYSLRPDLKILKNFYEQILQNTQLKKIISGCLGSKNYIYSINTMISIPSKNKHSVTDLHRDYDDTNFLALAVYWTDVESDDGATYFVPFTHNRYVDEKNNLLDKGVYLKGIAGSAYLMDTYGWHAGNKNLKKKRIVTWIRFSKNQFNVSSFDNKEQFFFKYFNELWN